MLSPDVKILAVYEDLLKRIEEITEIASNTPGPPGEDGRDGRDGQDAPDNTRALFAAIATLHSDLIKEMISAQRDVQLAAEVTLSPADRVYNVERDNKGLITTIRSSADKLI